MTSRLRRWTSAALDVLVVVLSACGAYDAADAIDDMRRGRK